MNPRKIDALLRYALACIGLSAWVVASAQDAESLHHQASFRSMLQRDDIAAIEQEYATLKSETRRSARGSFLADTYVDFSAVTYCARLVWPEAQVTQVAREAQRAGCWASVEARMDRWAKSHPSSALPAIGLSEIYLERAKTSEDREQDRPKVEEALLERARRVLEDVPAERREAIWYSRLMQIASMQGWGPKRFGRLLEEASAKYPNHALIYRQAAFHYLPRNGGSAKELEELAQLAVGKSKDLDGMSMYAHVYDEVVLGQGRLWQTAFTKTQVSWPQMRAGLQDIYERFPDKWNLNRFAQHACLAQDFPTLVNLLAKIEDKAQSAWDDGWGARELQRCRELASRQTPRQPSGDSRRVTASLGPR